jgi:hypothetical protein
MSAESYFAHGTVSRAVGPEGKTGFDTPPSPPLFKCNSGAIELPYKMYDPTITFK